MLGDYWCQLVLWVQLCLAFVSGFGAPAVSQPVGLAAIPRLEPTNEPHRGDGFSPQGNQFASFVDAAVVVRTFILYALASLLFWRTLASEYLYKCLYLLASA